MYSQIRLGSEGQDRSIQTRSIGRSASTRKLWTIGSLTLASLIAWILPTSVAVAGHGGDFTINSKAADPTTYDAVFPQFTGCPGGGRAADPVAGAQYASGVNSLTPSTMVLGAIVPFEFRIAVDAATPAESSIEFTALWDTNTTPAGSFGYSGSYLVYCAFVDTTEGTDPEGDASASVSSTLVGDQIEGVFQVEGLDAGDVVVVEAWVVLDNRFPPGTSGNVQARLDTAGTLTPDVDTINVGAETTSLHPDDDFLRAIMVMKRVTGESDPGQAFRFEGDIVALLSDGQVSSPLFVSDGSYTVIENLPAGWHTPSIECDDDDSGGDLDIATFNVDAETIVCTFTNSQVAVTTTTMGTTTSSASSTTSTDPASTTTASTLPYTGSEAPMTAGLALTLIVAGALVLAVLAIRRET